MSWNQQQERGIQVEVLLGVACCFLLLSGPMGTKKGPSRLVGAHGRNLEVCPACRHAAGGLDRQGDIGEGKRPGLPRFLRFALHESFLTAGSPVLP